MNHSEVEKQNIIEFDLYVFNVMFNNSNGVFSLMNNNLCFYLSHFSLNDVNTSYVSIYDYFNLAKLY